jgi:L-ascorbate 6-phosphate lactonase
MILRQQILDYVVPAGSITLWWLGQAGFVLKSPGGKIAVIDPYLTNSAKAAGEQIGFNFDRLVPPPLEPADLVGCDVYVLTHSHQDHLDPETLAGYRAAGGAGPYLAPAETVEKLHALGVPMDQITMTWPNKSWAIGDLELRATIAIPFGDDDLTHVGYLIRTMDGPTVYLTGDTSYHEVLAHAVAPHHPDVLLTVINPAFRNLGPAEAARLAKELDVKLAIPCHFDLFPANSLSPRLFQTNLRMEGIGDRYREPKHGQPITFPASHGQ